MFHLNHQLQQIMPMNYSWIAILVVQMANGSRHDYDYNHDIVRSFVLACLIAWLYLL